MRELQAAARPDLRGHLARPDGGALPLRPDRRDVPRQAGRGRTLRGRLRAPAHPYTAALIAHDPAARPAARAGEGAARRSAASCRRRSSRRAAAASAPAARSPRSSAPRSSRRCVRSGDDHLAACHFPCRSRSRNARRREPMEHFEELASGEGHAAHACAPDPLGRRQRRHAEPDLPRLLRLALGGARRLLALRAVPRVRAATSTSRPRVSTPAPSSSTPSSTTCATEERRAAGEPVRLRVAAAAGGAPGGRRGRGPASAGRLLGADDRRVARGAGPRVGPTLGAVRPPLEPLVRAHPPRAVGTVHRQRGVARDGPRAARRSWPSRRPMPTSRSTATPGPSTSSCRRASCGRSAIRQLLGDQLTAFVRARVPAGYDVPPITDP